MFNSISWTEFLLAIGCLAGAYYFIVGLLCYQQEIVTRLKGVKSTPSIPEPLPSNEDADNLLGAIKKTPPANDPEDSDNVDQIEDVDDQIQLSDSSAPTNREPAQEVHRRESLGDNGLVLGSIADLLEEVKLILSLFGDEKPGKEDLASPLRALLEKYDWLVSTRYLIAINIFVYDLCKETCSEELTPQDVRSWWPAHSPK
jgi:hypothetical protein